MYLGGSPFDLPGLFSILAYGEIAFGLWLPRGGIYALVTVIEQLARELGVRIYTDSRVERIIIENGEVRDIQLTGGQQIPASIVISNVDVPTTKSELLALNGSNEEVKRRAATMKMTSGVLTFYWGISGKVEGLRHHTIFLPQDYRRSFNQLLKEKRIPDDMPFYVSVPSATDASLAPKGDTAMFVLVPTPLLSEMKVAEGGWREIVEDVKERVLARLHQSGVKLAASRIIFERFFTPAEWQRRFGLYDGSAFGAAHTLRQVGPWRAQNYEKTIAGLYYVGASTTPGTGMPMVVLSGKMVAERIMERLTISQQQHQAVAG
jgi:phytoene desaturase